MKTWILVLFLLFCSPPSPVEKHEEIKPDKTMIELINENKRLRYRLRERQRELNELKMKHFKLQIQYESLFQADV